jgi:hypothetical protein
MKKLIIEIIIFLYVVLFLYAAGTKLLDYERSAAQIGQSPLLTNYAGVIAWLVPAIEIVIAMMLMITRFRLIALYASFGLMVIFTLYVAAILSLSTELPCACGGVLSMLHWKGHLIFNSGFVLLALAAIVLYNKQDNKAMATQN